MNRSAETLVVAATLERGDFSRAAELRLEPGETVGLTGDLGSGKSSVLALVAGRLRAVDGVIAFGPTVWDEPATSTFVETRPVTLLTQAYVNDLPEESTGLETVRRAVERFRPDDVDSDGTAAAVLDGLGVDVAVSERLPWTFSGAEAQRVALARALAPRPSVVLLDEPFGSLDKRTGAAVRSWLAGWLSGYDGCCIIASTNVDHLDPLTDRIASLT